MTELKVTREALERFAKTSDGRHRDCEKLVDKANDANVDRDSFGHVPGIGSRCYEAYHDHVAACIEGIGEASLAMKGVAHGMRVTKEVYDTVEDANQNAVKTVQKQLGNIQIHIG